MKLWTSQHRSALAVTTFGLGAANAAPHCVDKFSDEVAMSKCEGTIPGASDFHLVDGPDPVGTDNDIPATTPASKPKFVSAGLGKRSGDAHTIFVGGG
ncbi:hypothetical protein V2G26_000215 [Clonostachys chloroleuca]